MTPLTFEQVARAGSGRASMEILAIAAVFLAGVGAGL